MKLLSTRSLIIKVKGVLPYIIYFKLSNNLFILSEYDLLLSPPANGFCYILYKININLFLMFIIYTVSSKCSRVYYNIPSTVE
jgi:hypothetical protein